MVEAKYQHMQAGVAMVDTFEVEKKHSFAAIAMAVQEERDIDMILLVGDLERSNRTLLDALMGLEIDLQEQVVQVDLPSPVRMAVSK